MKTTSIIFLLACIVFSCEKTSINGVDFIGKWRWWPHPALESDILFEFTASNQLILHQGEESSTYTYEVFKDNTIQIDYGTRINRNEIVTYTKDSIEIKGFTISWIPEDRNTILARIGK